MVKLEEKEQFKQGAKCPYFDICGLYTSGSLKEEVELDVCGKGQQVDLEYQPHIVQAYGSPPQEAGSSPEGICTAFTAMVHQTAYYRIRGVVEQLDMLDDGHISFEKFLDGRVR